jgi:hypothetical protein
VKPGLHYPKTGNHTVVWFDPAVLALRVAKAEGVENEQVLSGTTEQAVEGLRQLPGVERRARPTTGDRRRSAISRGHRPIASQIGSRIDQYFAPGSTFTSVSHLDSHR